MVASIQPANLLWTADGPRSADFDDVYFSRAGGLAETRHVFLHQNRLEQRFRALGSGSFSIAETGFGTGLNFLATWALWQACRTGRDGWLHMISVDKHPLRYDDLRRALALWPELAAHSEELLAQYPPLLPGFHRLLFPAAGITLTLLLGDATEQLAKLQARVDAWFLDGFAPSRNGGMWSPALFAELARLSHPQTTLATFTAAGDVRRGLQEAGFAVQKVPGFGQKREMLTGHFAGEPPATPKPWQQRSGGSTARRATVLGAGIAGVCVARALAERGLIVEVIDAADGPARAASGNPAAMVYPRLGPAAQADEHFQQQAFLLARQRYAPLAESGLWNPCGVMVLEQDTARSLKHLQDHPWVPEQANWLEAAEASALAGIELPAGALHFPDGGWARPEALCRHWLDHPNIHARYNTTVHAISPTPDHGWQLQTADGWALETPLLILANAGAAQRLAPCRELPLTAVRGQIAEVRASASSQVLSRVICHGGYISPVIDGRHCLGASFAAGDDDCTVRPADNATIHQQLAASLPTLAASLPPVSNWQGRASLRCQTPDYLPIVGGLPVYTDFLQDFAGLRNGNTRGLSAPRYWPGLYVSLAHGSHGFTQALLAAEILAAEILGEPYPVPDPVLASLHPARFWVKALRRRQI